MECGVLDVICPGCDRISSCDPEGPRVCSWCGAALRAAVEDSEPDVGFDQPMAVAVSLDPEQQTLLTDLHHAFEFVAEDWASEGPPRLSRRSESDGQAEAVCRSPSLAPGSRLGDFEIVAELGRGGMGIVYRARQVSLGREVALKVLPDYAHRGDEAVRRFQAEAQAAARVHHTNVVAIHARGSHGGHCFYAMELIEGLSLDRLLTRQRAPDASPNEGDALAHHDLNDYRRLAGLLADVADGLACAHQQGVIHRDVKPHNLLLAPDGRLHLTDFGLARLKDAAHLTLSGEVLGTPAYLAPEQVRGQRAQIDHRADIYALGATLYELLTHRRPFVGETREQVLHAICTAEPPAPCKVRADVPAELETICLRAMSKDPRQRHPSAIVLAEDLRRFALAQPILSRRAHPIVRAGQWIRRHRLVATVCISVLIVTLLLGGWGWSVRTSRQREARQLLAGAYEQLAYYDYYKHEAVAEDIDRAAALGADPAELGLVQALAALGATRQTEAIDHLNDLLAVEPDDQQAGYLLAWALWRDGQRDASREAFTGAEALGLPASPDAWFFRGLAVHFADPETAVESYRRANALRAGTYDFYPLALLHLARARNQQMYADRSLEPFAEVDISLRQLIDAGHYRAYPHYLLSIAHRLAGEIYRGSSGTRDESLIESHFAEALAWASEGQDVNPNSDRCFVAEAECLESMGLYAEAVDARTRAIEVAVKPNAECESFHYRWRLHYWLGDYEAALRDVETHAACLPESRCYRHVYPALVLAELGDLLGALAHARAVAEEAPGSAVATIWSATCLRLLGRSAEATALLNARAEDVDFTVGLLPPQSPAWARGLYEFCLTGEGLDELDALAQQADRPWKLWGEAHFHAGIRRLAAGDRMGAAAELERAYRAFDGELNYTYHAKLILVRMGQEETWPGWLRGDELEPVSTGAEPPAGGEKGAGEL